MSIFGRVPEADSCHLGIPEDSGAGSSTDPPEAVELAGDGAAAVRGLWDCSPHDTEAAQLFGLRNRRLLLSACSREGQSRNIPMLPAHLGPP